jgi:hypothetical protein
MPEITPLNDLKPSSPNVKRSLMGQSADLLLVDKAVVTLPPHTPLSVKTSFGLD